MADKTVFVYLDLAELTKIRDLIRSGASPQKADLARLISHAEALIELRPRSVVDKTTLPASGDVHDFYAIGGYSWPNTESVSGLPYVYRDSETNPEALESDKFDKGAYEEMTRRVATLALAYFFTDRAEYAAKAADLLRTWFLNESTAMNPNFRYAAARPGIWDGHFSGVIEGVFLIELLDYVHLVARSSEWTAQDERGLRQWFGELTEWLATSSFGRREIYSTNNHGSYILAQLAVFSTYAGNAARAQRSLEIAERDIAKQITPAGTLPREINRADGWFYSIYGLRAFAVLARVGDSWDTDLWSVSGSRLSSAFDFLKPFFPSGAGWPYSEGHKPWEHDAVQLLQIGVRYYKDPQMLSALREMLSRGVDEMPYASLVVDADAGEGAMAGSSDVPESLSSSIFLGNVRRIRIEDAIRRLLGVAAARGLWPGRRL